MCEKIKETENKVIELIIFGTSSEDGWKVMKNNLFDFLKTQGIEPKGSGGELKGDERAFLLIVKKDEAFKIGEYLSSQGIKMNGSDLPN